MNFMNSVTNNYEKVERILHYYNPDRSNIVQGNIGQFLINVSDKIVKFQAKKITYC